MCKAKNGLLVTLMIGAFLVGAIPGVWAGPAEETAQMADQWMKAFHEGNLDAITALYAKDAVFTPFLGPFRVEGREGIRAAFGGLFRGFPTRSYIPRHVNFRVYGDSVIRHFYWVMTLVDAKGNVNTYNGRASVVYMVVDGQRVIVEHHTSLLPK